jgi:hypothetical protein
MKTYALIASGSIALALHSMAAPSIPLDLQAEHDQAAQLFKEQRFSAAYGRFMRLADSGHAPSALVALVMLRSGRDLFDHEWAATAAQQQRWAAMLVEASRQAPVAGDGGD